MVKFLIFGYFLGLLPIEELNTIFTEKEEISGSVPENVYSSVRNEFVVVFPMFLDELS
jgi:hypothetical protein